MSTILVVVDLHHARAVELLHDVIAALRRVPGGLIVRILFIKFPEQSLEPLDIFRRHRSANNHIAPGHPVLPVFRAQHPQGQLLDDVLELGGHHLRGGMAVAFGARLHGSLPFASPSGLLMQ
jgi:hypothetical protein